MKTMLVILAIAFFPSMNLFAEESRVEVQQQTGIEGSTNKATSSCNERVASERVVAWQNMEVAETEQDKCFARCERSRDRCYANGGSTIKCEKQFSDCSIPCT